MSTTGTPPIAMTIAGSDSGGGAGIQADLKTFAAHGVHGTSAIAALTAQSTVEVRSVLPTPPEMLRDQIETVLDDMDVRAVKTGMLATAANVRVVAELAAAGRLPNLVVDPVMVSSSGVRLLDPDAEEAYAELLQHATVATPNCREAVVLLGMSLPIETSSRQWDAATELAGRYPGVTFLVKGGDLVDPDDPAVVVDVTANSIWMGTGLSWPRVDTTNNHGTGCSLSSAIAARLALGPPSPTTTTEALVHGSIMQARHYVHRGLVVATDWHLGAGHGPIAHFADVDLPAPLRSPSSQETAS